MSNFILGQPVPNIDVPILKPTKENNIKKQILNI